MEKEYGNTLRLCVKCSGAEVRNSFAKIHPASNGIEVSLLKIHVMRVFVTVFGMLSFLFSMAQPAYAPFLHGVASGDPLTDKVILWTRVSPDNPNQPVTVNWRIATDTSFSNVVNSGSFTTDGTRDFTVKVDADSLQPGTWYYYDFETDGDHSLIGRTKTAPSGSVDQARFALATCAKYSKGFFNGYARIGERNDLDAVIHVGDYIYESDDEGDVGRPMDPLARCSTLTMYRTRYAQYRSDLDLVYAHQQYPWINVWDDHETGNDCWKDGSEHFPDSTEYAAIKRDATQAFFEWLPIREDSTRPGSIYRTLRCGDLIDIIMIDTRREGRMRPLEFSDTLIFDEDRTMLGQAQYDWLIEQLDSSTAQWRILGQQVMMAPLKFLGSYLNGDQWNGYSAEREKLLTHISNNAMDNVVVLTGDVHASFGWDIPLETATYDSTTHAGSLAVEFITPAIASSDPDFNFPFAPVKRQNPYIQYLDMVHNGYVVLDVTPAQVQGDFYFVYTTDWRNSVENHAASLFSAHGSRYMERTASPTQLTGAEQLQAPLAEGYSPIAVGVAPVTSIEHYFQIFPNPVSEKMNVRFDALERGALTVEVFDASLKKVAEKKLHAAQPGIVSMQIDVQDFPVGTYSVKITNAAGKQYVKQAVIQK